MTIQTPNVKRVFSAFVLAVMTIASVGVYKNVFNIPSADAAAEVRFIPQYDAGVTKPSLSKDGMAFIDYREKGGEPYVYFYDFGNQFYSRAPKEFKLSLDHKVNDAITDTATDGPYVVWTDKVGENYQVRVFNFPSYTTRTVMETSFPVARLGMSGANIVWIQGTANGTEVMSYDVEKNDLRQLTKDALTQGYASVSGDQLVYAQTDSVNATDSVKEPLEAVWEIVAQDLKSGAKEIIRAKVNGLSGLSVNGRMAYWTEIKNGVQDVWAYNLSTGVFTNLTNSDGLVSRWSPVGLGHYVVWNEKTASGSDLALYDLETGKRVWLTISASPEFHVTAAGDKIAWEDLRKNDSRIYFYDFNANPTLVDQDKDGLNVAAEGKVQSDTSAFDTDGDGINDSEEVVLYRTAPGRADTDGDGLTDYQETFIYHTDPNAFDTDSDTYGDGTEVKNGYSPLVNAAKNTSYKTPRASMAEEKKYDAALRQVVKEYFGEMPKMSIAEWKMYRDAYEYGGYTNFEVLTAMAGIKSVVNAHVAASEWRASDMYRAIMPTGDHD